MLSGDIFQNILKWRCLSKDSEWQMSFPIFLYLVIVSEMLCDCDFFLSVLFSFVCFRVNWGKSITNIAKHGNHSITSLTFWMRTILESCQELTWRKFWPSLVGLNGLKNVWSKLNTNTYPIILLFHHFKSFSISCLFLIIIDSKCLGGFVFIIILMNKQTNKWKKQKQRQKEENKTKNREMGFMAK
jgi:hypothetical protein